jgi:hypothetical protein
MSGKLKYPSTSVSVPVTKTPFLNKAIVPKEMGSFDSSSITFPPNEV